MSGDEERHSKAFDAESLTVPDQISRNKTPYYEALEAADRACADGKLQLNELEELLKNLLAAQLVSVLKAASQNQTPQ